jgi:hypothetical protein
MPSHAGPNIAGKSNLVFKYDTGDVKNSYRGKPTTNLLTTIDKSGTNDSTYFKTNSGTEVKYVSNVGVRTVHYVNILNDYYGGSGNCCPAPMFFGDFAVSPSTEYTYQIIYKTTTRYANANYMYHYEYNTGTYVTEYGLWSSSRETDLGDGWKHAWGTFTSNASTNRFITYLFHYEYGVWNKIEVAGVMLTQGNSIIPPTQFLNVGTTRSATQGLLPLVGNSTVNLTNVSFDSNGQIIFDGTNDYINIGVGTGINQFSGDFTVSLWAMRTAGGNYGNLIGDYYTNSTQTTGEWQIMMGPSSELNLYKVGPGYVISNIASGFSNNTWINVVVTRSGNLVTMYANSNRIATGTDSTSYGTVTGNLNIGIDGNNSSEPFPGRIDKVKIYNRALTAQEVRQNYQQNKTRFNLS